MALALSLPGGSCARGWKRVILLAWVVASGALGGTPEPFRPGRLQARREGRAWKMGGERRLGAPDRAPALFFILSTVTIVMVRRGYYSPRPRSQHSLCFPCLDYSNYFGSDYSNQFVSAGRGLKQGRALGARWEGGERATGGWGRGGRARDEVGIGLRGVLDRTGRPCSSEAHGTRGNLLLC